MICWNRKNGVKVSQQGSAVFRRNEIRDNQESGAYFTNGALGTLEANHISGNTQAGIAIQDMSAPKVRWNTITHNMEGIQIKDAGSLVVENNLLTFNKNAGITMDPVADGVHGNRSEENGTFGLDYIADGGQPAIIDTIKAENWIDGVFWEPTNARTAKKEAETAPMTADE